MNLWLLAILGAGLSWLGDVLVTLAARREAWWLVWLSVPLFGAGAPVWFYMAKISGGQFVKPAMVWNLAAVCFSLVAVLVLDGTTQTPRQWAGIALFFIALVVRG